MWAVDATEIAGDSSKMRRPGEDRPTGLTHRQGGDSMESTLSPEKDHMGSLDACMGRRSRQWVVLSPGVFSLSG